MKTKKFSRSLTLNKITIANLRNEAMGKAHGGFITEGSGMQVCLDPSCVGCGGTYTCGDSCPHYATCCCGTVQETSCECTATC